MPAPQIASARPAALASLSTRAGTLNTRFSSSASGKFRQQGRFGGLITTPVRGSSGPGEQTPMPASDFSDSGLAANTALIASTTEFNPAAASPVETIGTRE